MNTELSAIDVAKWFLSKESMTHKKIQKLVYYAYAWTLTLLNDSEDNIDNKLFPQEIEAWIHGPVIPEVYKEYRKHKWSPIPKIECEIKLSDDVQDILEQVWDIYGQYNANELESITHQEAPWIYAREGLAANESGNKKISDKVIFNYYSSI